MKKTLTWMLIAALALALFAPISALAAPGDVVLVTQDTYGTAYVENATTMADTGYLIICDGEYMIYRIKAGETEAEKFLFEEDDEKELYAHCVQLFGYGDQLMAMNSTNGKVYSVELADGRSTFTEAFELDWTEMTVNEGDYGYTREINQYFVMDDTLYISVYDDDYNGQILLAFSLTDGSGRKITSAPEGFGTLAPYKDGKLLAAWRDVDDTDWTLPYVLYEISTKDGTMTKLFALQGRHVGGLVYDPAQDRVIYMCDSTVYQASMTGESTDLATINLDAPSANSSGGGVGLIGGNYYFVASYEGTMVKNLDQAYRPTRTLTIAEDNVTMNDAYLDFTEKHPDTEVKPLQSTTVLTADEVVQAMMSGSSEVDIYRLRMSSAIYRTLAERGYVVDLSSSAVLSDMADRMFPVFKDALTENGKLAAFPDDISVSSYALNVEMAEEIGLTEPLETWDQLLDLVEHWDETYSKEFPEKALFDPYETANMKETLVKMLLQQQIVRINKPGAEAKFDTQTMRNYMSRLDGMSFGAFASDQDFSDGYSWNSGDVLFSEWGLRLPRDLYRMGESLKAMPLSFPEDEQSLIGVNLYVRIVNPYSKNQDLAIAYLESLATHMNEGLQATFFADCTEAIRDPYFDTNIKYYDDSIQETEAALAEAGDDEKQMYEERLASLKNGREDALKEEYIWTEEELAEYREVTEHFVVMRNSYFINTEDENTQEMEQLIARYVDGQATAEQMLSSIDQKIRMMQMEAGY